MVIRRFLDLEISIGNKDSIVLGELIQNQELWKPFARKLMKKGWNRVKRHSKIVQIQELQQKHANRKALGYGLKLSSAAAKITFDPCGVGALNSLVKFIRKTDKTPAAISNVQASDGFSRIAWSSFSIAVHSSCSLFVDLVDLANENAITHTLYAACGLVENFKLFPEPFSMVCDALSIPISLGKFAIKATKLASVCLSYRTNPEGSRKLIKASVELVGETARLIPKIAGLLRLMWVPPTALLIMPYIVAVASITSAILGWRHMYAKYNSSVELQLQSAIPLN